MIMNEREQEILRLNQAIIQGVYCPRVIRDKSWALPALQEIQIVSVDLINLPDTYCDIETWIFRSDYTKLQTNRIIMDFIEKWARESQQDPYPVSDLKITYIDLGLSQEDYDYYQLTIIY